MHAFLCGAIIMQELMHAFPCSIFVVQQLTVCMHFCAVYLLCSSFCMHTVYCIYYAAASVCILGQYINRTAVDAFGNSDLVLFTKMGNADAEMDDAYLNPRHFYKR
jgi:hypothetical protein